MLRLKQLFGSAIPTIEAQEAQSRLAARPAPLVLDVRQPEEFKAGHIAGATLIPLSQLSGRMSSLPREREILCVCASGSRSGAAARQLAAAGFKVTKAIGQTVGEVMERSVPTVPLEAELADIADQMAHAALKRVIVVDAQGRPVGSINDGDLVARIEPPARTSLLSRLTGRGRAETLPAVTARQLMTPGVLSGPASTLIEAASQSMLSEKRKRFVVVDEAGRLASAIGR